MSLYLTFNNISYKYNNNYTICLSTTTSEKLQEPMLTNKNHSQKCNNNCCNKYSVTLKVSFPWRPHNNHSFRASVPSRTFYTERSWSHTTLKYVCIYIERSWSYTTLNMFVHAEIWLYTLKYGCTNHGDQMVVYNLKAS